MMTEYFATLGLPPGQYTADELRRRFQTRRRLLLRAMDSPQGASAARRGLEELHLAHKALQRVRANPAPWPAPKHGASADDARDARLAEMRALIQDSLEGGLLRHSRRTALLDEGRQRGISAFHTHLLIAQVQCGDPSLLAPWEAELTTGRSEESRAAARLAAAVVLGLGVFMTLLRWVSETT
jgi:hypothetical protein